MNYLRKIDFDQLNADSGDRPIRWLLDRDSGAEHCAVICIKTPPGGGSSAGLHTHPFEQVFYLLSGTMNLEIAGEHFQAEAGTLIVFPLGTPHRNWNSSNEPSVHLSFQAPLVGPGVALSVPVKS